MKILKFFILLLVLTGTQQGFGQSSAELIQAIKNINMVTVESFMQDRLEFCIQDDQQMLSKAQASKKFKTFLDTNKPISMEVMHNGTSKDKTTQYKVVKMVSAQGTYRVFIYSEGEIRPQSVKEIRIDKF